MSLRNEVYECSVCGQIVEVVNGAKPKLHCCNKPMDKIEENTKEAATEKHIPVVEKIDGGYKVIVGDVEHPMADDHYIEWIELIAGGEVYKTFLFPGDKPVATFMINAENVAVRAYCNLHGLWKA